MRYHTAKQLMLYPARKALILPKNFGLEPGMGDWLETANQKSLKGIVQLGKREPFIQCFA